jgi:hypothetical protein
LIRKHTFLPLVEHTLMVSKWVDMLKHINLNTINTLKIKTSENVNGHIFSTILYPEATRPILAELVSFSFSYYLHNHVMFFKQMKIQTFKNYFSALSVNLLKSITQFIIRILCLPWCMQIVFHHINNILIWSRQLEVITFMAVNNNKRQKYYNSWNHIEVCNEKMMMSE